MGSEKIEKANKCSEQSQPSSCGDVLSMRKKPWAKRAAIFGVLAAAAALTGCKIGVERKGNIEAKPIGANEVELLATGFVLEESAYDDKGKLVKTEKHYAGKPYKLMVAAKNRRDERYTCDVAVDEGNGASGSKGNVVATVCNGGLNVNAKKSVSFECSPLVDNLKDFKCLVKGLTVNTEYNILVKAQIVKSNSTGTGNISDAIVVEDEVKTLEASDPDFKQSALIVDGNQVQRELRVPQNRPGIEIQEVEQLPDGSYEVLPGFKTLNVVWLDEESVSEESATEYAMGFFNARKSFNRNGISIKDVNGDGVQDILARNDLGALVVFEGKKGSDVFTEVLNKVEECNSDDLKCSLPRDKLCGDEAGNLGCSQIDGVGISRKIK